MTSLNETVKTICENIDESIKLQAFYAAKNLWHEQQSPLPIFPQQNSFPYLYCNQYRKMKSQFENELKETLKIQNAIELIENGFLKPHDVIRCIDFRLYLNFNFFSINQSLAHNILILKKNHIENILVEINNMDSETKLITKEKLISDTWKKYESFDEEEINMFEEKNSLESSPYPSELIEQFFESHNINVFAYPQTGTKLKPYYPHWPSEHVKKIARNLLHNFKQNLKEKILQILWIEGVKSLIDNGVLLLEDLLRIDIRDATLSDCFKDTYLKVLSTEHTKLLVAILSNSKRVINKDYWVKEIWQRQHYQSSINTIDLACELKQITKMDINIDIPFKETFTQVTSA